MTALPALPDASDLAATVERARALLDDGDVIAAKVLASGVYDQAKAAASFAERHNAARRLVEKARRLQGDALLIEARAKIRLAAEVDAAQERGELRKPGKPAIISDENNSPRSVEAFGLTAQEVHEARKLAAAEGRAPGIVERAIAARIAAGLEPSRANLRAAVGTASASNADRGDNFYETPREAVATLLSFCRFGPVVWEPACGRGAISKVLEEAGYEVCLSDLRDRGCADRHGELQRAVDFMETKAGYWQHPDRTSEAAPLGPSGHSPRRQGEITPDIVTNPPYGTDLNRFVAHALREHRPRRMALLLNLNFLCGFDDADRNFAMDEVAPAKIYVFTRRLPMMHRDGWDGPEASSRMNTAWFVWELDEHGRYDGGTTILRVDWKDFEAASLQGPVDLVAASEALSRSEGQSDKALEDAKPEPAAIRLSWEQAYEGGRILAKLGAVEVGAVFPNGDAPGCTWSFWLGSVTGPHEKARSVDAAKAKIEKRFEERSGLTLAERTAVPMAKRPRKAVPA